MGGGHTVDGLPLAPVETVVSIRDRRAGAGVRRRDQPVFGVVAERPRPVGREIAGLVVDVRRAADGRVLVRGVGGVGGRTRRDARRQEGVVGRSRARWWLMILQRQLQLSLVRKSFLPLRHAHSIFPKS